MTAPVRDFEVSGEQLCKMVYSLAIASKWFEVTPLPDNWFRIRIKRGDEHPVYIAVGIRSIKETTYDFT